MDIGTCTITFGDGTQIQADRNGDIFRTKTKMTEEFFNDNTLSDVSYVMEDGEERDLGECRHTFWGLVDKKYEFAITPLSPEEKATKLIQQAISDVSDAILEMSEIVYGEE